MVTKEPIANIQNFFETEQISAASQKIVQKYFDSMINKRLKKATIEYNVNTMQNTEVDVLEMEEEDEEEGEVAEEGEEEPIETIPPELEAKLAELKKIEAARSPEEKAEFEQFLLRQKMKVRDFRNK